MAVRPDEADHADVGGLQFQCDTRGLLQSAIATGFEDNWRSENFAVSALDTVDSHAGQKIRHVDGTRKRMVRGRCTGAIARAVAPAGSAGQRQPAYFDRFLLQSGNIGEFLLAHADYGRG